MGRMAELHYERRDDDYLLAMYEQAYYRAVSELTDFIAAGAVTEEQAFIAIKEELNGRKY